MSTTVVMNLVSVFKSFIWDMYFRGLPGLRQHDLSGSNKNCCDLLRKLLRKTHKIPYLHM